ncbi:MAG: hypothetical protein ACF8MF_10360 [Phycisphaerales bacterium JB052]
MAGCVRAGWVRVGFGFTDRDGAGSGRELVGRVRAGCVDRLGDARRAGAFDEAGLDEGRVAGRDAGLVAGRVAGLEVGLDAGFETGFEAGFEAGWLCFCLAGASSASPDADNAAPPEARPARSISIPNVPVTI